MTKIKTRCKFRCEYTAPNQSDDSLVDVRFGAVYDPDPTSENGSFWKWTPSGQISFTAVYAEHNKFEVGKEYYVDFSEVS